MNDEQRYLIDLQGFLHVPTVLKTLELERCRAAAARVVDLQSRQGLPPGCELEVVGDGSVGSHYDKVFSIEPALEALAFHPDVFPIVCELTDDQPKLRDGVLIYDDHRLNTPRGGTLHAAGEGDRRSARFEVADGRVYCDNFVVFFYLVHLKVPVLLVDGDRDDIRPGDGGLALLPGSHKSQFKRPDALYGPFGRAARNLGLDRRNADGRWVDRATVTPQQLLAGMKWVGPLSAGDVVIMPESTTHAALPWQPKDRLRRVQFFRFCTQTRAGYASPPLEIPSILERLAPETVELIESNTFGHRKKVLQDPVATAAWNWITQLPPRCYGCANL